MISSNIINIKNVGCWKLLEEPSAWLGHVPFGALLVELSKPEVLVELGSYYGHSYFSFCESVLQNKLTTHCYAVDTWQGDNHAGEYGNEIYLKVKNYNDRYYSSFSSLLRMTFDEALEKFTDASVDLLHIDGLHTYEAVKHDYETWLPKMSDKGIVLFHDTNVRKDDFGVWKLWEEVSVKYPSIHFDHSYGLGVLFVGGNQNEIISDLILDWKDNKQQAVIRKHFEFIGQCVENEWSSRDCLKRYDAINKELYEVKSALMHSEAEKNVMISSISWRITAPLRLVKKLIRPIYKYIIK